MPIVMLGARVLSRPWAAAGIGRASALSILVVVAAGCFGVLAASGHTVAVAAGLGVLAFPVAMVAPARVWPLSILVVTLLLPVKVAHVPIATPLIAGWLIAQGHASRTRFDGRALVAGGLGVWIGISLLLSQSHSGAGLKWTVVALLSLVLLPAVKPDGIVREDFVRWFVLIAAGIGAFAVLEAYVLGSNPLYGAYFEGQGLVQKWSTYRATATLGHPLVNGTVLAAALVIALAELIKDPTRRAWVMAALIAGGVVATQSRTAMYSGAVGAVLVLLLQRGGQRYAGRKTLLVSIAIVVAVVAWPTITERAGTAESRESAAVRSHLIRDTRADLGAHLIEGRGPGEAEPYRVAVGRTNYTLESAYAETAVGIGIVGLGLLVVLLLAHIFSAVRRLETVGIGVAIGVTATTMTYYSALEGHPELMIFIGLLLVLATAPSSSQHS